MSVLNCYTVNHTNDAIVSHIENTHKPSDPDSGYYRVIQTNGDNNMNISLHHYSTTDNVLTVKKIFKEFLFNIDRIGKFDKNVKEIYEIIEPIIDSYCNQIIQFLSFDKDTYNKIFNVLKTIRNNQIAFDTLKTIIIEE